jgi:DNA-binding LacI/PurR family transcriptional regulator
MPEQGNQSDTTQAPRVRALKMLRQWIESGTLAAGEPLPPERELSRQLQVGRATLQRALNVLEAEGLIRAHGHTRIVSATRHSAGMMIHAAVALLSFYRDATVQNMRDAWTEVTCRGALEEIRAEGRNALSFYLDRMSEEDIVQLAADRPLGVLIPESNYPSTRIPPNLLYKLVECNVNFVVCGDWPEWAGYDRVYTDHELGSYELTRWLVAQGCRRIMMLWPEPLEIWWPKARQEGYRRALTELGIEPLPAQRMVPLPADGWGDAGSQQRFEAESRYFAGYMIDHLQKGNSVDAILLPTDAHVFPVAAACRLLGRVPNKDVVLAGFDNTWQQNPYRRYETAGPAVTADRLNADLGREMMRLLAARSSGKLPKHAQSIRVAPHVIVTGELRKEPHLPIEDPGLEHSV